MPMLAVGELAARKSAFLEAFPDHGIIRDTCRQLAMSPQRVSEWLNPNHPAYDSGFADAFGTAKELAADAIESSLRQQALRGRTAWDTTAAIFLLKGYRPQFRDNVTINQRTESISITMSLDDMPAADKLQLLDRLRSRIQPPALPEPTDTP